MMFLSSIPNKIENRHRSLLHFICNSYTLMATGRKLGKKNSKLNLGKEAKKEDQL